MARVDLIGKKFNMLTVLRQNGKTKDRSLLWECRCDCGNITNVRTCSLTKGLTKSCGCLQKKVLVERNTKHGLCYTRLYKIYKGMCTRCYNPNRDDYKWYGGRGIQVCSEWLSDFSSFYAWAMANGYKEGLTIDRIDVDDDYNPENCRWVTQLIQVRNARSNRLYTYKSETHCLSEWAELLGINYFTLRTRLDRGWSVERAFNKNGGLYEYE